MTVKDRDTLTKDSELGDAVVRLSTLLTSDGGTEPKQLNKEFKLIDHHTGQQFGGGAVIRVDLTLARKSEAQQEVEDHVCE